MNFEDLSADLESQPIRGYLPDGRRIGMPLISHITDNLYVGGCIEDVNLGEFFSHIFSLYVWEKYITGVHTTCVGTTMYDSAEVDTESLESLVPQIIEALDAGGNVLVHCQAGINRSNLTAAYVLREWKGMTSAEAIALLRERRGDLVLANQTFEQHLLGLDQ